MSKVVKEVMCELVHQIATKQKKHVHWFPSGITEVRTFEIEPWRHMNRKPFSLIKHETGFQSTPFLLPLVAKRMEPFFDYDTYEPDSEPEPEPEPPSVPAYNLRPRKELLECKPSVNGMPTVYCKLERTEPISLDEVYRLAEELRHTNIDSLLSSYEEPVPGIKQ